MQKEMEIEIGISGPAQAIVITIDKPNVSKLPILLLKAN